MNHRRNAKIKTYTRLQFHKDCLIYTSEVELQYLQISYT